MDLFCSDVDLANLVAYPNNTKSDLLDPEKARIVFEQQRKTIPETESELNLMKNSTISGGV